MQVMLPPVTDMVAVTDIVLVIVTHQAILQVGILMQVIPMADILHGITTKVITGITPTGSAIQEIQAMAVPVAPVDICIR